MNTASTALLLCLAVLPVGGQTPGANPPVNANIDASKTGPPISPYVYGQFLEHTGNLIYSSLWSEMPDDRKFYYVVAPKPPGDPDAGPGGSGTRTSCKWQLTRSPPRCSPAMERMSR